MSEKGRENRLRRMAERQGLRLERSRRHDPRASSYGLYALKTWKTRQLVSEPGVRDDHALTLDEVEQYRGPQTATRSSYHGRTFASLTAIGGGLPTGVNGTASYRTPGDPNDAPAVRSRSIIARKGARVRADRCR